MSQALLQDEPDYSAKRACYMYGYRNCTLIHCTINIKAIANNGRSCTADDASQYTAKDGTYITVNQFVDHQTKVYLLFAVSNREVRAPTRESKRHAGVPYHTTLSCAKS